VFRQRDRRFQPQQSCLLTIGKLDGTASIGVRIWQAAKVFLKFSPPTACGGVRRCLRFGKRNRSAPVAGERPACGVETIPDPSREDTRPEKTVGARVITIDGKTWLASGHGQQK